MPTIIPVNWLHPDSLQAAKVISSTEEMTLEAAKEVAKLNPLSFVQMLVPDIGHSISGEARKEQSFLQINENLATFIKRGILIRDEKPSIYIYQIRRGAISHTGVWTCTSIADFENGTIKAHEITQAQREEQLEDYFEKTGIDANPILVTYRSSESIVEQLSSHILKEPDLEFAKGEDLYKLWSITQPKDLDRLVLEISKLESAYIADGHHRAAAALKYSRKTGCLTSCFSTVYMADDQLDLFSFNRLVSGLDGFSLDRFLQQVEPNFQVQNYDSTGLKLHEIGLYTPGSWIKLIAKPFLYQGKTLVNRLDVSLLQEYILQLLPDNRITFISGKHPVQELEEKVDSGDYNMAFVLAPPSPDDLFTIADKGEKMPAKSTSFEPKFPAGLLIHHLNQSC